MAAQRSTMRRATVLTVGLVLLVPVLYFAYNRPPPDPVIAMLCAKEEVRQQRLEFQSMRRVQ